MITDINLIKEARYVLKTLSKDFCGEYVDMCGKTGSEVVKSSLDGQLRLAEKLSTLENFYE